ncbi:sugar transferase [Candidatus Laterigemmans baculatus]|uniref:sugar transferase n=1 Tax=Candidatus Laterigemmans baculatus TaxID=2770505 RepID=UPI0013DD49B9|nr:sugar transferase [Candidatus Laterigemmans baculatus]
MSSAEQILTLEPAAVEDQSEGADERPRQKQFTDHTLVQADYWRWKYGFERLLSCLLFIPAAPVILLLCACVKLTSKGPALYRQVRLGLNGQPYEIFKIRTMSIDAEADGVARWCVKNDPRITPLGRIFRKLHLDEFPQLINVVRGEMALIGPRPERPQICAKLATDIENYYDRLRVKPGISGLAQINLPPDETLEDARRKQVLDLLYIEQANLWLDSRMLFATALRVVGIRGGRVMRLMGLCRRSHLTRLPLSTPLSAANAERGELVPEESHEGAGVGKDRQRSPVRKRATQPLPAYVPRHPR